MSNVEKHISPQLEQQAVNTIRFLSADMVQKANSGHPGLPMGMAQAAFTLWSKHLRFNPKSPSWFGRDRFVLSAGHGSALLYALLYLFGYDISLSDLKTFPRNTYSAMIMRKDGKERGNKPID